MLDRRFIDANLIINGFVNSPPDNPAYGAQYIVGTDPDGDFKNASPNYIARYNGSEWLFYAPRADGLELINAATGEILKYDNTSESWKVAASFSSSLVPCTEIHTLTAQEATAKSFSLSNNIATGQENNIQLFVSGIAQAVGVDFAASGNTISWSGKGLEAIGMDKDDIFIVHYYKQS